jgi:hypothetical protein
LSQLSRLLRDVALIARCSGVVDGKYRDATSGNSQAQDRVNPIRHASLRLRTAREAGWTVDFINSTIQRTAAASA